MDFFTDASLNSAKSIAGIGCVCVDDKNGETSEYSAFYQIDNIHFAELYALTFAVQKAVALGVRSARIISDSAAALNMLHRYMKINGGVRISQEQKQFLRCVEVAPLQKAALDKMIDVFKNSGVSFKFVHVNGHQKTAQVGSDGYWNKRADRAAKKGRAFAEVLKESQNIRPISDMLENSSEKRAQEDWRSRIQVPYVQVKSKDKTLPKKVKHHKKVTEDAYNIRIMLNLRIKVH